MSAPGRTDGWVRVCGAADLGEDEPVHADVGRCPVCLVRTGGALYALRDECTHQAVPPSEGEVAGGAIECWLHGSRFDLATGRVLSPPATRPVAVYGARIDGEDIFVHLGKDEGDSVPADVRRGRAHGRGRAGCHGTSSVNDLATRLSWRGGAKRANATIGW